jgi:hypothetical protein
MEPKHLLPRLERRAAGPCPELDESNPHPNAFSITFILI